MWISRPKWSGHERARRGCGRVLRSGGGAAQSETVWRQATKYQVPRIAFVNKMDRIGANFDNALNDMRKKLNACAHAIYLPIGAEDSFEGVIDVVNQKAITWGTARWCAKAWSTRSRKFRTP